MPVLRFSNLLLHFFLTLPSLFSCPLLLLLMLLCLLLSVLSSFPIGCFYAAMEKAMATHSSILAWKIPWMEEPGRPQSMGSLRVGHDWASSLSFFTFMHWRRKWQPTPVFLPGESQGWGSLVGCHLWGRTVGHDWSDLAAAGLIAASLLSFHLEFEDP